MPAQAAYNLDYAYAAPARNPRPGRTRTPDLRVTPGTRSNTSESPAATSLAFKATIVAIALAVIAVACVARIAFSSATVQTDLATQQVNEQLEEARATGTMLEVQETSLANATRVKAAASALNMTMPEEVVGIILPADVVVLDDAGSISLSESISTAIAGV